MFVGTSPNVRVLVGSMDDVVLRVDRAIRCSMIVHELMTNAVQHGFPDGRFGTVELSCCKREDGAVVIRGADDGVGLSESFESNDTVGWMLVRALACQIHAAIELDLTRGATVQLVLDSDPPRGVEHA